MKKLLNILGTIPLLTTSKERNEQDINIISLDFLDLGSRNLIVRVNPKVVFNQPSAIVFDTENGQVFIGTMPHINHKNKDIINRYNNSKTSRSTCRDWKDHANNNHDDYNGASAISISYMIASY